MIRFMNAFPTSDTFTVWLNDKKVYKELFYEEMTSYKHYNKETLSIKLTSYKEKQVIYEENFSIHPNKLYTFIITPHPSRYKAPSLYAIEDSYRPVYAPDALLRVVHFAYDLLSVDCYIGEDILKYKNISPYSCSRYLPFSSDTYNLNFYKRKTKEKLLTTMHYLKPIRFYSAYLIGLGTIDYPYKIFWTIDGQSYISQDSKKATKKTSS